MRIYDVFNLSQLSTWALQCVTDVSTINAVCCTGAAKNAPNENFLGRDMALQKLKEMLFDSSDVGNKAVGICGMGGVGKTELALALYNSQEVSDNFQYTCLLRVGEGSDNGGGLDKSTIKLLLDQLDDELCGVYRPVQVLRSRLQTQLARCKCFLVLDDVWNLGDLEWLIINMGPGSRIVVTARDRNVFSEYSRLSADNTADRLCKEIHEYSVDMLSPADSMQLLCKSAFNQPSPPADLSSGVAKQNIDTVLR